jgi:SPP1 family predicted phage head-tail adaptor
MRAGGIRTQLNIIAPPTNRNAFNEVSTSDYSQWTLVTTLWGQIKPLRGSLIDITQANAAAANSTLQIIIRYNDLIRVTHRIQVGGINLSATDSSLDQLAGSSLDQLAAMNVYAPPVRYFTIQGISDENWKHRMMTLYCAEPNPPK